MQSTNRDPWSDDGAQFPTSVPTPTVAGSGDYQFEPEFRDPPPRMIPPIIYRGHVAKTIRRATRGMVVGFVLLLLGLLPILGAENKVSGTVCG